MRLLYSTQKARKKPASNLVKPIKHFTIQLLNCTSRSNKPKIRAKELQNGPSARDYKVDDCLLDVPDDEEIVVIDDSTATKYLTNYLEKSKQNTPSKQIKISSFPNIPSKGSSLYLGPL